eukprot:TRINITY_DN14670_c0_g1_i2.p1 TRINITY_DN14670_c0_g1~~TRINITY_DN14670_c0_g1_i2.p1  ORF type:complete len:278 (+),score=29.44 TRINITY_DN14670_c0_g1_i2:67-900(+)
MRLQPTHTCCGCVSLLAGVQMICSLTILIAVCMISVCSSEQTLLLSGLSVSPRLQVALASWAFVGIPAAINAGVGMLFHIESALKLFYLYHVVSVLIGFFVPMSFWASGSLCNVFMDLSIRQMGTSFMCSFADTCFVFWLLLMCTVHAYFAYILWSAAFDVALHPYAELERYRVALKGIDHSPAAGVYEFNPTRAIPHASLVREPVAVVGSQPVSEQPILDCARKTFLNSRSNPPALGASFRPAPPSMLEKAPVRSFEGGSLLTNQFDARRYKTIDM